MPQHIQHQPERRHTQPPSLGVPTPPTTPTTGPAYSPEALAALVNATAHATNRGGEPMKLLDAQGQSIQLSGGMGGGALNPRTAAALQGAQGGMAGQALGQAASGTVGRQYPDMLKVSSAKPPLQSLGATGTAIFSGIITSEEYNPDFYWRDAIQIYEQMIRNDAQVFAAVQMLELPIRRATWSIVPATESLVDKEIASFVETCLFHDLRYQTAAGRWLTQKWDDVLRHILMMFRFGFMPFEVCWRVDPGGWVKWSRFTPLLPRTIYRWWVGADNELAGVQQWTYKNYSYEYIDIPADKLLLFVHRQEGNNYEGVSVLRSAYKNWYYKDNFYRIEAVAIERNAISVPVIGLPENFTDSDIQAAQKITANLRANENLGVTLPPGWTFEYAKNQQKYAAGTEQPIAHHDVMIARNILAQFINLGSTETGAFALDASQKATFLAALQAQAEYIEDVFNNDAIPRLVDYNYAGVSVYPRLKCSKVLAQDFDQIANALNKLSAQLQVPFIHPDPELEDFLRNELGLPSAPQSVIQAYNPSGQSAAGQQEPGAGDPGSDGGDAGGDGPGGQPQAGQGGLPSENDTGGGDDGGDGGAGGALREEDSERAVKLFNHNHDSKGRFAVGSVIGRIHGAVARAFGRSAPHGRETARAGSVGTLGEGAHVSWGAHREAAQTAFHTLLGRQLADHEVAALVGARPGDHVTITSVYHGGAHQAVMLQLEGAHHAYLAERHLTTGYDSSGNHPQGARMENAWFEVYDRGHGVGSEVFAREAAALSALGVREITTHADLSGVYIHETHEALFEHNGFYTWPRLGYDATLKSIGEYYGFGTNLRATPELARAKTVRDIFATEHVTDPKTGEKISGAEWWLRFGKGFDGTFDLAPGSKSMQTLEAYLHEKGRVMPTAQFAEGHPGINSGINSGISPTGRGDEIEWTPDDEAAAVRAWAHLIQRWGDDGHVDEDHADANALSEVRLLRESLDAIWGAQGLDAVSRGERSREARESIKLFNPRHDPKTGQFAPGGVTTATRGGQHAASTSLAHLEAAHARAGAEYTRLLGEHRAAAHAAGDALRALGDDRAGLAAHTADEAGPHGDYQRALAHVKDLEGQVKAAAGAKARAWGALDQARGGTGVRIERAGEDATAQRHVLGRDLADHELVALAGARLGDTLHVQGARTKTGEPEVRLYVQGAQTQHTMRLSREGADVVAHEEYLANKGTRGTESGHELLAGMETLRAAGVTKVRASAARAEGLNGYDTWAKLGFDGPLPAGVREAAQERFGAHVGRVSDVLAQPGGQAWWKQHGATFDAEFDFTPGSHSMTRYEALRDRLARHNKLDEVDAGLDFLGVLMLVEEEDEGYRLAELIEDFDGDAGSIRLFNPNHDTHTGQFTSGPGGGMGGLHAATGHAHGANQGSIHGAGSRMAAHGHSTGGSGGAGSPHPGHQWEARRQMAHDELRQAEQDHADADRRLTQATAEAGRAQVEHTRAMDALDAAKRALRADPGNAALRAEVDQRVRAAAQKSIEHDDARQAMADRERELSDAAQNHRDAERMVHATERAVQTGEHPDDLFDHMDAHGQVMPFTDHDVFDAWNTGTANTGPQNTPGHGWTSTESRTADLGGQKYYLKRNEDVPGPTGQLLASSEGQARSESATVAGLQALGMGDLAPREAYHVVGSDGLHYSVISGEPGERLDRAAFDQATMGDVLDHARGEDLQRLVVGQYLLGVRDRHTGNLLYDAQTGGVKAIDFGLGLRENPHADQAAADRVLLLRQAAKRAGVDFMRMRAVNTLAPHVRLDPAMVHAALSHEPEVLKVLEDFGASRMAKSAARQRFAIVRALAAQHPQGMSVQDLLNATGTAA